MARAIGREYAAAGYGLQLAGRDTEEMQRDAADYAHRYQIPTQVHALDVLRSGPDALACFYAELDPKPAGVVCAIGLLGDQTAARQDPEQAYRIMATNYLGVATLLDIVAADFERRREGFIVGLSSVAGERGRQSNYLYGSAKAGLTQYLEGLRHRLRPAGVRVLTVKPGFVRTQMTAGMQLPKPLTATPEQVGRAVYRAQRQGRSTLYVLPAWRGIMWIIRNLPGFLFYRSKL